MFFGPNTFLKSHAVLDHLPTSISPESVRWFDIQEQLLCWLFQQIPLAEKSSSVGWGVRSMREILNKVKV